MHASDAKFRTPHPQSAPRIPKKGRRHWVLIFNIQYSSSCWPAHFSIIILLLVLLWNWPGRLLEISKISSDSCQDRGGAWTILSFREQALCWALAVTGWHHLEPPPTLSVLKNLGYDSFWRFGCTLNLGWMATALCCWKDKIIPFSSLVVREELPRDVWMQWWLWSIVTCVRSWRWVLIWILTNLNFMLSNWTEIMSWLQYQSWFRSLLIRTKI